MSRFRILAVAAVMLSALGLAAYAVAAQQVDSVATYTGCLKNGKIESLAVGDAPLAPCNTGQTQVRLSGGDVTAVAAGTGLLGGGDNGDLTLAANPNVVQFRVAGSCESTPLLPRDASITAIHRDGTVECNPDDASDVFSGFYDGPAPLPHEVNPDAQIPIAKLALPPGSYAVVATFNVQNDDTGNANLIGCRVSAGVDFDLAEVALSRAPVVEQYDNNFTRISLQVAHKFAEPGDVIVSCGGFFPGKWSFLKITATRVANVSNGPLTLLP